MGAIIPVHSGGGGGGGFSGYGRRVDNSGLEFLAAMMNSDRGRQTSDPNTTLALLLQLAMQKESIAKQMEMFSATRADTQAERAAERAERQADRAAMMQQFTDSLNETKRHGQFAEQEQAKINASLISESSARSALEQKRFEETVKMYGDTRKDAEQNRQMMLSEIGRTRALESANRAAEVEKARIAGTYESSLMAKQLVGAEAAAGAEPRIAGAAESVQAPSYFRLPFTRSDFEQNSTATKQVDNLLSAIDNEFYGTQDDAAKIAIAKSAIPKLDSTISTLRKELNDQSVGKRFWLGLNTPFGTDTNAIQERQAQDIRNLQSKRDILQSWVMSGLKTDIGEQQLKTQRIGEVISDLNRKQQAVNAVDAATLGGGAVDYMNATGNPNASVTGSGPDGLFTIEDLMKMQARPQVAASRPW